MDRGKGAGRVDSAEGDDVGKHRPEGERRLQHAAEIMGEFADETGLTSGRPARRYLWTDALGVCTSLGLHEETGDDRWRGLGGLLALAWWTAWLGDRGRGDPELLEILLRDAAAGLSDFVRTAELDALAGWRLAFRELGLAVGLSAAERLAAAAGEGGEGSVPAGPADSLRDYLPLRREIEEYWLREEHRQASTWREHRDISRVALVTSLAPGGYLDL